MYRSIFTKTMRDGRRSLLWGGIGLFLLGIYVAVLFPSISQDFGEIIENLPEFLKSIVGDAAEFSTPEGFFTTQPFGVMAPIIMMAFAIHRGIGAVSGEEEAQTLDQLMANPITRTSIILHKSVAMILSTIILSVFLAASLIVGAIIVDFTFSMWGMIQMLISLLLLSWSVGFMALAAGSATGSKSVGIAVSATVGTVGYLIHILAPFVEAIDFTKYFSVMYYYIGDRPFVNGLTPWHAGVLAIISLISLAVAIYAFNQRDLH